MYHTTLNFTATAGDLIAHLPLLVVVYIYSTRIIYYSFLFYHIHDALGPSCVLVLGLEAHHQPSMAAARVCLPIATALLVQVRYDIKLYHGRLEYS